MDCKGIFFTAGDMPLPVFVGGANIQQDCAIRSAIFFDTLIDVRAFQKIEESHLCTSLQHGENLSLRSGTGDLIDNLSVLHNHQSGYAHHTELHSQFLFLIHIYFNNLDIGALLAISSTRGTTMRQGPHQGAQKSIKTGLSEFKTS